MEAAQHDRTPHRFYEDLWESLRAGEIDTLRECSIRACFEQFVEGGRELVETFRPGYHASGRGINLLEAGDAITTTAFSNITGQIVYSEVLDIFDAPDFLASRVASTVPTQFSGEKIPGVSELGDVTEKIGEGQPYPRAGVSEQFIETPETDKHGVIVPVTKEAIFFDRTGVLIERANKVSESLAIRKEKRVLDTVLGITTSYRRNGTSAQATYANTHTEGDFDNLIASNGLSDWTNIEAALNAFDDITDPETGEPVMIRSRQLIVPTALLGTAARILEATQLEEHTSLGTDGGSGSTRTVGGNPLNSAAFKRGHNWELLSSQYVKDRTSSTTTWFLGDFSGAFAYYENWPVSVVQAPPNSHDEFHRDIVSQFKVSERGTPVVKEPRKALKNTA